MSRKIKLTKTKTYTKTATIEIEYPNELHLESVNDWLYENQVLWSELLEWDTTSADMEYDSDFDDLRYDVVETTEKYLCGGQI